MHFGPVHHVVVNFITNCCIRIYRSSVLLLSRNPLSLTDASVVPPDNLCLTDINSFDSHNHALRDSGLYI